MPSSVTVDEADLEDLEMHVTMLLRDEEPDIQTDELLPHVGSQPEWVQTRQPDWEDAEEAARQMPLEIRQRLNKIAALAPRHLEEALHRLASYGTGMDVDASSEELFQSKLASILLDDSMFRPGNLRRHAAAWHALLDPYKGKGHVDEVLRIIDNGVELDFVKDPFSEQQRQKPGFERKAKVVRTMLEHVMPPQQAQAYMASPGPDKVWLGNLRSAETHHDFVTEEVYKLRTLGTMITWKPEWGEPQNISPLGVAVDRTGKKRLVGALMYVNFKERYRPFTYEKLQDTENYVQDNDWLYLTDAKSGYHHISVNPKYWKYLCFRWQDQVYCYPYLVFGLQSACRTYTILMQEVYRVMRLHGEEMTFLIDDKLGAARTQQQAKYQAFTTAVMMTALGFFLSSKKCKLLPVQEAKFLGLIISTKGGCCYKVPQDKLQYAADTIKGALAREVIDGREAASIAGILMALRPAIALAPLYVRGLYHVVRQVATWDTMMDMPLNTKADLRWWLPRLDPDSSSCVNGNRWRKPYRRSWVLVADTSETAHAGVFYAPSQAQEIVCPFTAEQWRLVSHKHVGSTPRETKGVRMCFDAAVEQQLPLLQHKRVKIICDNAGTVSNYKSMNGSSEQQLADVRRVYELAFQHDIDLEFVWQPRESQEVQHADRLSKLIDPHDFHLASSAFDSLCQRWGCPTVDAFASGGDGHKCARFFALYSAPGCIGCDAFLQPWNIDRFSGAREFVYAFPGPLFKPGPVLRKIQEEKCDVILVLPTYPNAFWQGMLINLPIQDKVELGYWDGLYAAGPMLPTKLQDQMPRVPLTAYYVKYVM